jgi:hypothetical protein
VSDGDCTGGTLCHAIADPGSPTGVGAACAPPCTTCGAGFRCSTRGACEAIPCDEGFACAAYERCDPTTAQGGGAAWTVGHGCLRVACTSDPSCPTGQACVNGSCQEHAGSCRRPEAVP